MAMPIVYAVIQLREAFGKVDSTAWTRTRSAFLVGNSIPSVSLHVVATPWLAMARRCTSSVVALIFSFNVILACPWKTRMFAIASMLISSKWSTHPWSLRWKNYRQLGKIIPVSLAAEIWLWSTAEKPSMGDLVILPMKCSLFLWAPMNTGTVLVISNSVDKGTPWFNLVVNCLFMVVWARMACVVRPSLSN